MNHDPDNFLEETEVDEVELHLSAHLEDFLKRFGKRIKKAGGRYSECRGQGRTRFVHVPVRQMGAPYSATGNRDLIDELIRAGVFEDYRSKKPVPITVIFRGGMYDREEGAPTVASGLTLAEAIAYHQKEMRYRFQKGYSKTPEAVRAARVAAIQAEAERLRSLARAALKLDGQSYEDSEDTQREVRRVLGIDKLLGGGM